MALMLIDCLERDIFVAPPLPALNLHASKEQSQAQEFKANLFNVCIAHARHLGVALEDGSKVSKFLRFQHQAGDSMPKNLELFLVVFGGPRLLNVEAGG